MPSNKRNLKENKKANQGQGQISKESAEAITGGVLQKRCSYKQRKTHWKTPVSKSD